MSVRSAVIHRTPAVPLALAVGGVLLLTFPAPAADGGASTDLLLVSPLGQTVAVPTNAVPAGFLPPRGRGVEAQIPSPARGGVVPDAIRERLEHARAGREDLALFPSYQPRLAPYLASQDEIGNTAIKPGSLLPATFLDTTVQQGRYWASEIGLRYSLSQTFTWASLSDALDGVDDLAFYTLSWHAKWALYDAPSAGTAGWITAKIAAKTGLNDAGDRSSAARSLGSAVNPTGIWSSVNGFRVPELAWQQSLAGGEVVVVAGMVNQSDYLDANAYANSGRGQFLNSALINSMVVPLPGYNFGLNLQWQPEADWYALLGASAGHGRAGVAPWTGFAWDNWSTTAEFGYAPKDLFGWGPGVYRVLPFIGQVDGDEVEGGFGLNFQQQLGAHSPVGWFGRYSRGGAPRLTFSSDADHSATGAQVGTGLVMRGPLSVARLLPSRAHDAAGVGFVWSHPRDSSSRVHHSDEYAVELGYVLQLTPTAKLQPDLQFVWNRAYHPDPGLATVFQLQLDLAW